MRQFLNTLVSLLLFVGAGLGLAGLSNVGGLPNGGPVAAAPGPAAASPPAGSATATPVPNILRAGPDPLALTVTRARPALRWPPFSVVSSPARLQVWAVHPDSRQPISPGPNGFTLVPSPLSGQPGEAELALGPAAACGPDQLLAVCYDVAVPEATAARLSAGQYSGTIYASDGSGAEIGVPVTIAVGRSLWVLVVMVVLGILSTEGVVWWRTKGHYDVSWQYRRADWLTLVSREAGWVDPFTAQELRIEVARGTLSAAQSELRSRLQKIHDWLAQLRAGALPLSTLPANADAAALLVSPLSQTAEQYLDKPVSWRGDTVELAGRLQALAKETAAASETLRRQAAQALVELCEQNQALIEARYRDFRQAGQDAAAYSSGAENGAVAGLAAGEALWQKWQDWTRRLGEIRNTQAENLTSVTAAVSATAALATSLAVDVIAPAREQLPPPEQAVIPELSAWLRALIVLEGPLKAAFPSLVHAQRPFRPVAPPALDAAADRVCDALEALEANIACLACDALSEGAIQARLVAPLWSQFTALDARITQGTAGLATAWPDIKQSYAQKSRFTALAQRLVHRARELNDDIDKLQGDRSALEADKKQSDQLLQQPEHQARLAETLDKERDRQAREDKRLEAEGKRVADVTVLLLRTYSALAGGRWLDAEIALLQARALALKRAAKTAARMRAARERRLAAARLEDLGKKPARLPRLPMRTILDWAPLVVLLLLFGGGLLGVTQLRAPLGPTQPTRAPANPAPYVLIGAAILVLAAWVLTRARVSAWHPWLGFRDWARRQMDWLEIRRTSPEAETRKWRIENRLLQFLSLLLSLGLSVTVIIGAREAILRSGLATWGTSLDMIVAYTWGALAHRLLGSLQSNWEQLQKQLQGE